MIIQIRGTSGSGKSWVMREVMKLLRKVSSVTVAGRKQPLYYQYEIFVLGNFGHVVNLS